MGDTNSNDKGANNSCIITLTLKQQKQKLLST